MLRFLEIHFLRVTLSNRSPLRGGSSGDLRQRELMRGTQPVPIRRLIQGTDFRRRAFRPQDYPVSPAIESLLSQPTWSVRTLLPPTSSSSKPRDKKSRSASSSDTKSSSSSSTPPSTDAAQDDHGITLDKLHHLLRLSALPLPKTPQESSRMLSTLRSQIHFVRAIQQVNTSSVEPLITIRDETPAAIAEQTITLEKMLPYLELEEKVGRNGTVRRRDVVRTPEEDAAEKANWEVDVGDLGEGSELRRRGKWFYVKRGKDRAVAGTVGGESEKGIVDGGKGEGLS